MNKTQKKIISDPGFYLMHYNHNHDSLGRFASGLGYKDTPEARKRLKESGALFWD